MIEGKVDKLWFEKCVSSLVIPSRYEIHDAKRDRVWESDKSCIAVRHSWVKGGSRQKKEGGSKIPIAERLKKKAARGI